MMPEREARRHPRAGKATTHGGKPPRGPVWRLRAKQKS
jgi:hypothetical protein